MQRAKYLVRCRLPLFLFAVSQHGERPPSCWYCLPSISETHKKIQQKKHAEAMTGKTKSHTQGSRLHRAPWVGGIYKGTTLQHSFVELK